jgi:hypothetical protein
MKDPESKGQNPEPSSESSSEDEPLLGAYETDSEPSTPIFVEVFTEEAVEYFAPETPVSTGDLIPGSSVENEPSGSGADTLPYPTISGELGTEDDLAPEAITEETEEPQPIPRPFGTTAPIAPKPEQKESDTEK